MNTRVNQGKSQRSFKSLLEKKGIFFFVIVAVLLLAGAMISTEIAQNRTIVDIEADIAVKQLWSEDDNVRLAAKAKLIALGPKAVTVLMAVLQDLESNPGPRYVSGKEKEGEEALQYYRSLRDDRKRGEFIKHLARLEINGRLRNDVYELLGALHAEEAVPLLVEIMERQELDNLIPGMTPVMRGLADIGPAAVPRLIDSIERARITAVSSSTAPDLSREAKQRSIDWKSTRIQENAVLVLEKIGDARALPILETLLTTTENEFLARIVGDAIKTIRNK